MSERRARLKMLETREDIYREKLNFYRSEYEQGKIPDTVFEEQRQELEAEMDEIAIRRQLRSGSEN